MTNTEDNLISAAKSVTRTSAQQRKAFPEDIRRFIVKRGFLVGVLLTPEEFSGLKARTLRLPKQRIDYIRAFRDGWIAAKS